MAELFNAGMDSASATARSVVFAKTLVAGIDLRHPLLTPENADMLRLLSDRHQTYIRHGRGREAHAMALAMRIVWGKLCQPDIALELPSTLQGDL
jgi:hypothetical protein